MKDVIRLFIEDPSQVGQARRMAINLGRALNFSEVDTGKIALLVTELGTNLIKHAQHGEILLRTLDCLDIHGIEILVLDRGPGIPQISLSLLDGFSTKGSLGIGLGAVVRSSSQFDIYSKEGKGTVVMARIWSRIPKTAPPPRNFEVGVVQIAKDEEDVCGDGWAVHQDTGRFVCILVDGLGHGMFAAEAAQKAIDLFRAHTSLSPKELLIRVHEGLLPTRGAAVTIVEINPVHRVLRYAGIGNISSRLITSSGVRSFLSINGIAGDAHPNMKEYSIPWEEGDVLVQCTDGLKSQIDWEGYPQLFQHHPSVVAGVLFRDYNRNSDDSTILVARYRKETEWKTGIPCSE
ncbi:MAG: ATP-binding protein/SpoIIE family protein phosphatase [Spirochaetes bacterium]|nr:ATP-binding protein/SpoIIE family protein phosphatase [Spirochaetota bacterium]